MRRGVKAVEYWRTSHSKDPSAREHPYDLDISLTDSQMMQRRSLLVQIRGCIHVFECENIALKVRTPNIITMKEVSKRQGTFFFFYTTS